MSLKRVIKAHGFKDFIHRLINSKQQIEGGDAKFMARRHHMSALEKAKTHLLQAMAAHENQIGHELVAEDLRFAHQSLGQITGETTSDALLGEIFSSFCIGK